MNRQQVLIVVCGSGLLLAAKEIRAKENVCIVLKNFQLEESIPSKNFPDLILINQRHEEELIRINPNQVKKENFFKTTTSVKTDNNQLVKKPQEVPP